MAFLFERFFGRHGIVHGTDKKRQPGVSVNLDMREGFRQGASQFLAGLKEV
jgi:hypothetical protein